MKTDLHIHSRYSSDGEVSTDRILQMCLHAEVDVFTISDHNTVRGAIEMEETLASGAPGGISFIPSIEIDCVFEGTDMHLLGFGIDTRSHDFEVLDAGIRKMMLDAFYEMEEKIREAGFPADRGKILDLAGDNPPVGEMIIEAMLTDENRGCELLHPYYPGGSRSDMPYLNFYFDWFAQGCPAYVPVKFMDFKEAVELIKANGGTPVAAHPGLNFRGGEDAAVRLLEQGAEGLECFNNYHTAEQARYFASLAEDKGALITSGSDYHGKVKPLINIGELKNPETAGLHMKHIERSAHRLLRDCAR